MTITIEAVYEQGILRLLQPIPLAEGTHVEVIVISTEAQPKDKTSGEILPHIAAISPEAINDELSSSLEAKATPTHHYPLRGLPILIAEDFDEPMPEMWEALGE
jgi:predicted DNA-binding antitoxin AbrB/MazE fold protein